MHLLNLKHTLLFPAYSVSENLVTLQVTARRLGKKSWLTSRPDPASLPGRPRSPPSHGTYYSLRYEKRASERAGGGRYVLGALVTARLVGTGAGAAQDRVIVEFLSRSLRQFRLPRCERGRKGRDEGRGRGIARVTTE